MWRMPCIHSNVNQPVFSSCFLSLFLPHTPMHTKTLWLEALRALGPVVGHGESWLQNTLPDAPKKRFTQKKKREKKKKQTAHNLTENRKNRDKCTHPSKQTHIHAPPPICIHTFSLSLLFSVSCYLHPVLPLGFFLSRAAVTLCPFSLCDQGVGAAATEQAQLQAWSSISPLDSTMKAGRAGRGRMSHPRLHSPRKTPCKSLFCEHVCAWNFKCVIWKV